MHVFVEATFTNIWKGTSGSENDGGKMPIRHSIFLFLNSEPYHEASQVYIYVTSSQVSVTSKILNNQLSKFYLCDIHHIHDFSTEIIHSIIYVVLWL